MTAQHLASPGDQRRSDLLRASVSEVATVIDKQIKVVVIDDHALVHDAISSLIDGRDDMILIAAETSATRGLRIIADAKPDVAVVDISLGDMNGLLLAERIANEVPQTNVVMLTMHDDRLYVQRALEVGAKGYVSKRSHGEYLLQAIVAAAAGGVYIDPAVAQRVLGCTARGASSKRGLTVDGSGSKLTEREESVVRLVSLGYTAKEIAGQLGVTMKSVETYKARACEKLGFKSRMQLVRYAATQGWLTGL